MNNFKNGFLFFLCIAMPSIVLPMQSAIIQQKNTKEASIDDANDCPICYERPSNLKLSLCQHGFCRPCIIEWAQDPENNCPVCRRVILRQDLREPVKKIDTVRASASIGIRAAALGIGLSCFYGGFRHIMADEPDSRIELLVNYLALICGSVHLGVFVNYPRGYPLILLAQLVPVLPLGGAASIFLRTKFHWDVFAKESATFFSPFVPISMAYMAAPYIAGRVANENIKLFLGDLIDPVKNVQSRIQHAYQDIAIRRSEIDELPNQPHILDLNQQIQSVEQAQNSQDLFQRSQDLLENYLSHLRAQRAAYFDDANTAYQVAQSALKQARIDLFKSAGQSLLKGISSPYGMAGIAGLVLGATIIKPKLWELSLRAGCACENLVLRQ